MKKNSIIWGIVLIALGIIFGLNALGITNIDVFFPGWWTLFIIIPCAVGLFSEGGRTGCAIGLCIGVLLLLWCLDLFSFGMLWKLAVPVIIIIIGVRLIVGSFSGRKSQQVLEQMQQNGDALKSTTAVFSGQKADYSGQRFCGAELTAVFGGVQCDLRSAVLDSDCVINATAIFGGVDIFVPDDIKVKINSTSLFGGASNKKASVPDENAPTLYVNATCMFGGVDVK